MCKIGNCKCLDRFLTNLLDVTVNIKFIQYSVHEIATSTDKEELSICRFPISPDYTKCRFK